MPTVQSKERFFDFGVIKKFGKGWEYGQKIYGQGFYGETEIEMLLHGYGVQLFGYDLYGINNLRWGIYQRRHDSGKVIYVRENFYIPKQTWSQAKQDNWDKFANGMAAWKLLTSEEKEAYNREANKLHLHGVNLFLRRWLNSY